MTQNEFPETFESAKAPGNIIKVFELNLMNRDGEIIKQISNASPPMK